MTSCQLELQPIESKSGWEGKEEDEQIRNDRLKEAYHFGYCSTPSKTTCTHVLGRFPQKVEPGGEGLRAGMWSQARGR